MRLNEATSRVFDRIVCNPDLRVQLDQVCQEPRPVVTLARDLELCLLDYGWARLFRSIDFGWDEIPAYWQAVIIDSVDLEAIVTLRIHDLRGLESPLQDPVY